MLELVGRFILLISMNFITSDESAHALKLSNSKALTGQGALDCGTVHCSIYLVSIDLMIICGRNTSSLLEIVPWDVQCVLIKLLLIGKLIGIVLIGLELVRVGLIVIRLVGIHEIICLIELNLYNESIHSFLSNFLIFFALFLLFLLRENHFTLGN